MSDIYHSATTHSAFSPRAFRRSDGGPRELGIHLGDDLYVSLTIDQWRELVAVVDKAIAVQAVNA